MVCVYGVLGSAQQRKPSVLFPEDGLRADRDAQRTAQSGRLAEPPRMTRLLLEERYREEVHSAAFPLMSYTPYGL
jgi:hypothetical protein